MLLSLFFLQMVIVTAATSGESCVGRTNSVVFDGSLVHGWREREVVCDGIYNDDAAGAGIIESVAGGGYYDVEELVLVVRGMWSMMIVGRFVVASNG